MADRKEDAADDGCLIEESAVEACIVGKQACLGSVAEGIGEEGGEITHGVIEGDGSAL